VYTISRRMPSSHIVPRDHRRRVALRDSERSRTPSARSQQAWVDVSLTLADAPRTEAVATAAVPFWEAPALGCQLNTRGVVLRIQFYTGAFCGGNPHNSHEFANRQTPPAQAEVIPLL